MASIQQISLITGANKGIGFEVAKQLGTLHGHKVLVGARDTSLGEAAVSKLRSEHSVDAHLVVIDVTSSESIKAALAYVIKEFGRLDVLINNAGIADMQRDGGLEKLEIAAVRRIFDVNFFGAIEVAQTFLPLLKQSEAPRIVNVSSGLGSLTLHSDWKHFYATIVAIGYESSKAALNMFTVKVAYELRDHPNFKINAADPGYTATDLNNNTGYQTVDVGARETVRLATLDKDGPTGSYSANEGVVAW